MKKYLFKQAKKSLSLFMAVIMLMSCWVWMAPEEATVAQAADAKTGYEVTFNYKVTGGKDLNNGLLGYKHVGEGWNDSDNGTVTTKVNFTSGTGGLGQGNQSISFTVSEFPTVIRFKTNGPAAEGCGDAKTYCRVTVQSIQINGKTVYTAADTMTWEHNNDNWDGEFYPNLDANGYGTSGNQAGTYNWNRPYIAGFVDTVETSNPNPAINLTVGKLGGSAVSGSSSFDMNGYTCVDQYGRQLSANLRNQLISANRKLSITETSHISNNFNGTPTSHEGISASGNTVTVSPEIQVSNNLKADYYLVKTYVADDGYGGNVQSKTSAKINLTYPDYTVKFDAKGTVDDGEFAPEIIVNGTAHKNSYQVTGKYNSAVTIPSDKDVSADGYTFYGFWTEPQPTSGDGWFYSKNADFAKPVSNETFEEYKKIAGAEVNGKVITVDADGDENGIKEKYYNAGTQYTDKKMLGDATVYGWWCSEDYTVKFYDVDGKFINEFAVKYGQTAAAIQAQNGGVLPTSAHSTYTSGAFTYTITPGVWVTGNGTDITLTSHRFTESLVLTPKLSRSAFKNEYAVKFTNPANGGALSVTGAGTYGYRQNITDVANEASGKVPATLSTDNLLPTTDLQFRYEFIGWTDVEPTGKNYHILLENANFDENGKAVTLNSDWIVRSNATYYAVYRRYAKSYNVNFAYKNTTGADTVKSYVVKYGDKIVPPADVPNEYNVRGNKYTFANWTYTKNQAGNKGTFGKNAELTLSSENILITNGALAGGTGAVTITAAYGAPVATPFKVGFTYPDDKGEDVVKSANVLVDTTVANAFIETGVPFVAADELKPAVEFDDGTAVYTCANKWKLVSGAGTVGLNGRAVAVGEELTAEDLLKFVPTSDVEFEAVYANPVYYRNVTYIDRDKTFVGKALAGTAVPVWTNKVTNDNGTPDDTSDDFQEDKIYNPEGYEGNGGTYVFQGWYDAEQTDETFDKTNGNKIDLTTAVVPDADITYYAQYIFVPYTYSIAFKNYDGSENIQWGEFQDGWSLEGITAQANKGAQNSREDDPVYDYIFIGWDKTVPTFCEGKDMVFIAQYKAVYKYYNAKWYNSTAIKNADGDIIGWAADKSESTDENGDKVETALLATTKHTYDSKLYTPSVASITCPEAAPAGQDFVFAGWCYDIKDEDGNVIETKNYERGMKITAGMEFYATYALSAKTYKVTAIVDGKPTYYTVASGMKAAIDDPQEGYLDSEYHTDFAGWYTDAEFENAFDLDTAITEDITVYAKIVKSKHEFTKTQLKTNPTYYAEGENEVWCVCDPTRKHIEKIPMLVDDVKPTGTIYLGSLGKWSSTDTTGAAATDGDEVTLVANADTDIIITANDTGKVDSLYNPSGIGKGVKLIRAFVFPAKYNLTADNYGAAQQVAMTVYENNTEALTNNANFAVKLGDAYVADLNANGEAQYNDYGTLKTKALESGETYIVYYYVIDKAGNQLNTKVRTAKFMYDSTAPVFNVEGNNNGAAIPTYCGTAKITGVEEGAVLTVNGAVVTVAADGSYVINYSADVDNIILTATDVAGNSYTKKIKVSDHKYTVTEVPSDCLNPGYKEAECSICGHKTEREDYEATGHVMGQPAIIPADCVNNGYTVVKCQNCDYEIKTEFDENGEALFPALDHVYEMDGEEIKYTTVTVSTCKTKGMAEAYCTDCGEGRLEKELDLDPANHEKVTVAKLDATCEYDGYYTETCICNVVVKNEVYPKTGHGNVDAGTAEWYIKVAETCCADGTEALKCLQCLADIDTKVIPADESLHVYIIADKENDVQRPSVGKPGSIKWTCSVCGDTYTEEKGEALEAFDVKFVSDDGETVFTDLIGGSMIGKEQVAEPTKAADEKYTYKFAGWVEVIENEDGTTTDGAVVKLPLTVTKDMTLKATFRSTPILYKHTFYVPVTWTASADDTVKYEEYAVLIGTHGDSLKPSSVPVFKLENAEEDAALKKLYTFEFKGWKNSIGEPVTDFTVTTDTNFYAYFDYDAVSYPVTYLNGTDYVWDTTVSGGAAAVYNNKVEIDGVETLVYPEKKFDDKYHYEFFNWYTEASLKTVYGGEPITAKTQLYAGFTAIEHKDYVVDTSVGENGILQEQTCTLPELTQFICTCGHTKVEETKAALEHDEYKKDADGNYVLVDGEKVLNAETVEKEDGIYYIIKCSNCGEVLREEKTSYTVVFKNWNGITLQTSVLNAGAEIKYEKEIPTKAADAEYTYTFAGWCVYGDKSETIVTLGTATEDATYTAVFAKEAKTFRVTFVDKDNEIIATKPGFAYGYKLLATDFPEAQASYFTKTDHYTFIGWSVSEGYEVKGDVRVKPVFEVEAHDYYNTGETVGATCEEAGGVIWKCKFCDATVNKDGAAALGHKWEEIERVEPNVDKETDGYYIEKCTVCGTVSDKIVIEVAKKRNVTITVKDSYGKAINGALVELYLDGTRIAAGDTNMDGMITFKAYEGKYTVLVSKVADAENTSLSFNVGKDGYSGEIIMEIAEEGCGCSCHRNGFWGIIFRLFHKIIKFFTGGKIRCCADPDGRY